MIDFSKRLQSQKRQLKVNPIEIYETLDRSSETGPLRPTQNKVLNEWVENHREKKDLIVKLHTGEGKTLIGLLMLMSYMNEGRGPVIYVCPNYYLLAQVCSEAEKFGIPYCFTKQGEYDLPDEFYAGKKILITYVQKMFNGKTIFGLKQRYIRVAAIILDDSHACINSIRDSYTIKIKKQTDLYDRLKGLFEEELKLQGEGSFLDLSSDKKTVMQIPYWSWIDKSSDVISILGEFKEEEQIRYAWPIIKDVIQDCQAYISYEQIEISPIFSPIQLYGTFQNAPHRILMSATTQEDSFFLKGLDFSIDAVRNPLGNRAQRWSGEKMILMPSLFCQNLSSEEVLDLILGTKHPKLGIIILVPSFEKARNYERYSETNIVYQSKDIFKAIDSLKKGEVNDAVVLSNRYDGIDLPDSSCRILIVDGMPWFSSHSDKYEELCRDNSDIINIKLAQKIEQGLGRSVRGEKDYSVIVILGSDLVKFLKSILTNKYFSEQTRKQVQIGLEIAEMAKDEASDDKVLLRSLINQCLRRDEGWKDYYITRMDEEIQSFNACEIYETLQKEREAEKLYLIGHCDKAAQIIQNIIDSQKDQTERGWYLQIKARYLYKSSKEESNELQMASYKANQYLLKPRGGVTYSRINRPLDDNRMHAIKKAVAEFTTPQELLIHVDALLSHITFGTGAESFERSLKTVGELLGFTCQRPDKEIGKGPDVLWCIGPYQYMIFECKSDVKETRDVIYKSEAGQMEEHCGWFESEYETAEVKPIMIIPTNKMAHDAYFSHKVEIMQRHNLTKLCTSLRNFFKDFSRYEFAQITDGTINSFLESNKLDIRSLLKDYSIEPK